MRSLTFNRLLLGAIHVQQSLNPFMNYRTETRGENIGSLICCWHGTCPHEQPLHVVLVHSKPLKIEPHVAPSRPIELPHSTLIISQQFCSDKPTGHFKDKVPLLYASILAHATNSAAHRCSQLQWLAAWNPVYLVYF
jgi:hypothetical protein